MTPEPTCSIISSASIIPATAFDIGLYEPRRVRRESYVSLTWRPKNRDFAAWLGLVPRQHSSAGKARLGHVSKTGQRDLRRLLIIGAMSVVRWAARRGAPAASWLARILARKPRMLVAIALANKMARVAWASMAKGEDHRVPAAATQSRSAAGAVVGSASSPSGLSMRSSCGCRASRVGAALTAGNR